MAFLPVPAVFPVLPVVAGWLLALLGGLVSLVFAALTLRRDGWRTLGRVGWRLAPGLVVWGLLLGLGAWGWRWVRASEHRYDVTQSIVGDTLMAVDNGRPKST